MNRILYDEELKGLVSERERLESLLNEESRELTLLKRILENLLKTKKKEISNKLEAIKYNSYMDKTINKFVEKLLNHFEGSYWHIEKYADEYRLGEYLFSCNLVSDGGESIFLKHLDYREYCDYLPEEIVTYYYVLDDRAKTDVDKLKVFVDLPNYAEDFMNYVIIWRLENPAKLIPEEKLEEIYNTIIEKYSLNKENILKKVK